MNRDWIWKLALVALIAYVVISQSVSWKEVVSGTGNVLDKGGEALEKVIK